MLLCCIICYYMLLYVTMCYYMLLYADLTYYHNTISNYSMNNSPRPAAASGFLSLSAEGPLHRGARKNPYRRILDGGPKDPYRRILNGAPKKSQQEDPESGAPRILSVSLRILIREPRKSSYRRILNRGPEDPIGVLEDPN